MNLRGKRRTGFTLCVWCHRVTSPATTEGAERMAFDPLKRKRGYDVGKRKKKWWRSCPESHHLETAIKA